MRTLLRAGLVVTVAVLMASPVLAQGRRGGGQGRGGFGGGAATEDVLVANEGVQKEIKLSVDQVQKVKDLAAKLGEGRRGLRGLDQDEAAAKRKELADQAKKGVAEILNADQAKRVHQIYIQVMGPNAFANEEVVTALKLNDDQKEKIKTINADTTKDIGEVMQAARGAGDPTAFQDAMKKTQTLRKEATGKCVALLTDDQKKSWDGLVGKPFDYVPAMRGRRGGN